jgi:Holliday junction resolvase RusA-like endonuclease
MAELPLSEAGREFTIELPAGLPVPNLNDRAHWAKSAALTRDLKKTAWAMALQARVPALQRAEITVEYQPPGSRRRDPDNLAPAGKACIDGLVAAGVLPDDNSSHVAGVRYEIGPVHPPGRLVIRVRELEAIR